MKSVRLIIWALCTLPLLVAVADVPVAHRVAGAPGPGPGGPPPRGRFHPNENISEDEWGQIQHWMKEHTPNRLAFLMDMKSGEHQARVRQLIVEHYRQMNRVSFQPLRQAMVKRAEAQDKIFGAGLKIRAAHGKDTAASQAAEKELRDNVAALFDASLDEKEARAEHLKLEINSFKQNKDRMLKQWYDEELHRAEGQYGHPPEPPPEEDPASPHQ